LVHWPLMGGLLHLVQRRRAWAGCGPAQSPHCCTKCNSHPSTASVPTSYYLTYSTKITSALSRVKCNLINWNLRAHRPSADWRMWEVCGTWVRDCRRSSVRRAAAVASSWRAAVPPPCAAGRSAPPTWPVPEYRLPTPSPLYTRVTTVSRQGYSKALKATS